ncbi:MAG: hypothetical protein RLZZ385_2182 [Pseudomonadota bacterium]|jgi:2-octaprenylphenol hydroxylase
MKTDQTVDFDIVIAGGGMVGAALACALTGKGLSIAVLDARAFSADAIAARQLQPGFDLRVSAIAPLSRDLFIKLGIWDAMTAIRVSPYQRMQVWDGDGTGAIDFHAEDVQQTELGFIIENSVILAALYERLLALPDVTVIAPAQVERLTCLPGLNDPFAARAIVHSTDGQSWRCALLVAADGPDSRVRQLAGFRTREWDYKHHALVTTVCTDLPHQGTALQRFMTDGPLAFLPLQGPPGEAGNYCSIVWSTVPARVQELLAMQDTEFASALAAAIEHRLGDIQWVGTRGSFPLRQRHAVDYAKDNIVLAGDAAHTIHPLAGQGVNLGLQDVGALAREIDRQVQRGRPVNDPAMLGRYQRQRSGHNLMMMLMMEGFQHFFAQQSLPLRWIRNAGLSGVDRLPLIKNQLIRQAAGY